MANHQTIIWNGASGTEYAYEIWDLPANFDPNQDGNYIYTFLNENNLWIPIYIGQGDLKDRTENHHQADCIRRNGATHIHVHLNSGEKERLAEERDILSNFPGAYQPTGCNEREGG